MARAARSRRSARARAPWRNRVAYVACVARTANDFRKDGLISVREMLRIVLEAGKSRCGARSGN